MIDPHELGKIGEDLAVEYLQDKGYQILERNWRSGHKEIDIIAYTTIANITIHTIGDSPPAPAAPSGAFILCDVSAHLRKMRKDFW